LRGSQKDWFGEKGTTCGGVGAEMKAKPSEQEEEKAEEKQEDTPKHDDDDITDAYMFVTT
jgi:hypothetical protein